MSNPTKIAKSGEISVYYYEGVHEYHLYWENRQLAPYTGSLTEIMNMLLHEFNFDDFAEIVKQVNAWQKEVFQPIY